MKENPDSSSSLTTGQPWRKFFTRNDSQFASINPRRRLDTLIILLAGFAVVALGYMACAPGNRLQSTAASLQREPVYNGRPLSEWVADLQDHAKQQDAVVVLAQMGPRAKMAVPSLIEILKHQDGSVRSSAASVLGRMGGDAQTAVPSLVDALKDSNRDVRLNAAIALQWISSGVKRTAVAALIDVLQDRDPSLRGKAALALGDTGPDGAQAVPALRKALKDGNERVRSAAAGALKRIESESTRSGA